jgi:PAS domain S-box-containing protein
VPELADSCSATKSPNAGGERIFGYGAEEIIGKPNTILVPPDYQKEEEAIVARIRRGQRVEPFETVRQRKYGSLIDVALTVSPVKNLQGIIGSSKIARDITDRKRKEARSQRCIRCSWKRVGREPSFTVWSRKSFRLTATAERSVYELSAQP